MSKRQKFLIASHDAGGAEILSAWARRNKEIDICFALQGPAVKIFSQKISNIINIVPEQLPLYWNNLSTLLMGTSWKSDFERLILKQAKLLGLKTIAFLDHWSNYEIRFKLGNELVLPDEIWTGDEYAYDLACQTFGEEKVKLFENPYFADIELKATTATPLQQHNNLRILYVCGPVASIYGYTEFYALSNYIHYALNSLQQPFEIKLRLHPSEDSLKYDEIIQNYKNKVAITKSENADLVEDCLWADYVVGCQTNALVIGLKLGKKVYSCIPEEGKPCLLPFPDIIKLFKE